jgi:uncharacterized protein (DUF2267 family)
MKLTGLDIFDNTVQKTNGWLKDVMQEMNWTDRRRAYLALRSVLHAVRDHLSPDDALRFAEDLPMLIRGFYFENWAPSRPPHASRNKEEFLFYCGALGEQPDGFDSEAVVRGVFRMLDRKATEGEIRNPYHLLPGILQEFWPQTRRAA